MNWLFPHYFHSYEIQTIYHESKNLKNSNQIFVQYATMLITNNKNDQISIVHINLNKIKFYTIIFKKLVLYNIIIKKKVIQQKQVHCSIASYLEI